MPNIRSSSLDEISSTMRVMWAARLGRETVCDDDDFFVLGGFSLLAVELTAQMEGVFEVEIPLREFYLTPTVGKLSEYIAARLS